MSVKKLNEELAPNVIKKTKKIIGQGSYKNFWETGLTVGKLRKFISEMPDNINIVLPGMDHTYEFATIKMGTALFDKKYQMINEDHGEDITPEAKYGKRREVVIIT